MFGLLASAPAIAWTMKMSGAAQNESPSQAARAAAGSIEHDGIGLRRIVVLRNRRAVLPVRVARDVLLGHAGHVDGLEGPTSRSSSFRNRGRAARARPRRTRAAARVRPRPSCCPRPSLMRRPAPLPAAPTPACPPPVPAELPASPPDVPAVPAPVAPASLPVPAALKSDRRSPPCPTRCQSSLGADPACWSRPRRSHCWFPPCRDSCPPSCWSLLQSNQPPRRDQQSSLRSSQFSDRELCAASP